MNINEMHIGLELALQELNSNLYNTFQHEEKDYLLNRTIEDFVRAVVLKEENNVRNFISYTDIQKYYEMINPFIRDISIGFTNYQSEGFVEGFIPQENEIGELTAEEDFLVDGAKYLIVTAGDTPLASFGYFDSGNQSNNDEFICNIDEIDLSVDTLDIYKGEKYRIVNNPGGGDFTSYGAITNEPGEEFIVNQDVALDLTAATDDIRLKPLIKLPAWTGVSDTVIRCIDDIGIFGFISSESLVACGLPITSGELTKDKYYVILTAGTTNLKVYTGFGTGGNDVGVVFKCLLTGTPTWAGGTRLYEISNNPNRLVKYHDKGAFLNHSYGTVISSPISTLINNKLRVYHDNKFSIYGLKLQYVKTPVVVNYNEGIDCNLPKPLHGKIVTWTAMRAAGISGNPGYNAIKDYEITEKQTEK